MIHFIFKKLPYFLLSLPLAILLLLGWQLGRFSPILPADIPNEDYEGSRITDLHIMQHDGQRLAWTLEAPQALNRNNDGVDFNQPRFLLLRPQDGETRVRAGEGWVSEKGDLAIFQRDVVLTDEQNRQLTTKSLRFEPEQGILYSEQPFQWHDGGLSLEGVGFRLNQRDKHLRVPQAVRAVFISSPQQGSQGE